MSTPQNLETFKAPLKDSSLNAFSGDRHPLAFNPDKREPVLLAQNVAPKIGEGPGQPGNPNPNPNPIGEGGKPPLTVTSTSSSDSTAISTSNSTSTATGIGEGGKGGQGGQGGQGGVGIGEGGKGGNASAKGGDATSTANGGTATSKSIGEGGKGGIGEGGTGTGGSATGGSNSFSENSVSNFVIPRQTVPVIPGTFTPESCVNGTSLGGATPWAGMSFSHQKPDPSCEARNNKALEYQKQTVDSNLQFQKDVHQDQLKLDQAGIAAQLEAAKAQAAANQAIAAERARLQNRQLDCDNMLKMSAEARNGYGNLTDLGNQARAGNPAAAQLFNSESALPPAFAMGSLQAMEACGYKVDASNLGMKLEVPKIEVVKPEPVKTAVTHRAVVRPKGCEDDPAVLRSFLGGHPDVKWTADDKTRMTAYFKDKKITPTEAETKKLNEK